uniref:Uncharacterized protein n=1 Tax=Lotharella oceanica TaxID=641309 RepID=A0A7S2XEY9_9EUKA
MSFSGIIDVARKIERNMLLSQQYEANIRGKIFKARRQINAEQAALQKTSTQRRQLMAELQDLVQRQRKELQEMERRVQTWFSSDELTKAGLQSNLTILQRNISKNRPFDESFLSMSKRVEATSQSLKRLTDLNPEDSLSKDATELEAIVQRINSLQESLKISKNQHQKNVSEWKSTDDNLSKEIEKLSMEIQSENLKIRSAESSYERLLTKINEQKKDNLVLSKEEERLKKSLQSRLAEIRSELSLQKCNTFHDLCAVLEESSQRLMKISEDQGTAEVRLKAAEEKYQAALKSRNESCQLEEKLSKQYIAVLHEQGLMEGKLCDTRLKLRALKRKFEENKELMNKATFRRAELIAGCQVEKSRLQQWKKKIENTKKKALEKINQMILEISVCKDDLKQMKKI